METSIHHGFTLLRWDAESKAIYFHNLLNGQKGVIPAQYRLLNKMHLRTVAKFAIEQGTFSSPIYPHEVDLCNSLTLTT